MTSPARNRNKVLFLTSSAPRFAGDSTAPFILNMARDLNDLGWDVEILAPHARGLKTREVIDGVVIRRFRYLWPARLQTLCYNGGAAVNLRRNRLNLLAVPFFVVAEALSALSLLLFRRASIIHSHWVVPQGVVGQMLSLAGIPHVISIHGADVYGFRSLLARACKAWALRRCDHVIVNSSSTRAEVERMCRARALSVIPTGTTPLVGMRESPLRRDEFASPDDKVLLFVGRLIEAKGLKYLIEALPGVLRLRRVVLLVVGEGPDRAKLEEYATELGLERICRFIGGVPHDRVYDYFALSDVFIAPSITMPGEWTEAQGNALVEALFARVPVVASNVGGIPDAIIDGSTGLLVEQRAPDQIGSAVLRILSDAPLAERLRSEGHKHALSGFSRLTSARRIAETYLSLAGDPN